jgi:glucose/arabinose dehydrogenase
MKFGPVGNLYVTSSPPSLTVLRYNGTTGNFIDVFASGPQTLSSATDLAFGPNGNLYVSTLTNGIFQFDGHSGSPLGQLIPPTRFQFAESLAFDPAGTLYVSTGPMSTVQRYGGSTGTFIDTFIPAGLGGLHDAEGIGFGPDGNLYVAGLFNDAVLGFDSTSGALVRSYSAGIDAPQFFTFVVPEPGTVPLLLIAACTILNRWIRNASLTEQKV